jgi:Arc/MetJ-type ribon-helix-helix transcriptional regulator
MKRYSVLLKGVEQDMLNAIIDRAGYHNAADALRTGLRLLYRRELKDYGLKSLPGDKKEEDRGKALVKASDPAKYCKDVLGGEVTQVEGQTYCLIEHPNGVEEYLPLNG